MKKLQLLIISFFTLLIFTACVSTSVSGYYFQNHKTNTKTLITEWKYMGFNQPFPNWVIPALENNVEKTKQSISELKDSEIVILQGEGYNSDQAENDLKSKKKPYGYELYDSFWVGTDSETNIEKMYISVAVYHKK